MFNMFILKLLQGLTGPAGTDGRTVSSLSD